MKIKKSDLLSMIQEQSHVIAKLIRQVNCHHEDIIRLEGVIEPEPQLVAIRSKRDIAKELLEVDLSSELTGSELCKAMLARGDRWILCGNTTDGFASPCIIDGYRCSEDDLGFVLTNGKSIEPRYIYPVNNQGEPLTAREVGL